MFVEHKEAGEVVERPLDEASKLLLKAATLIEERGWCQGDLETADGRLCALGALRHAAEETPFSQYGPHTREARTRLERAIGTVQVGSRWNDLPCRTQAEVVAKLRSVALTGK